MGRKPKTKMDDNVYRAEAIVLQEQLASTREIHADAMQELRRERISWRADKKELEQLRRVVSSQQNFSISEVQYMRQMAEEQAQYEETMNEYADQVKQLKETVQNLQHTNKSLQGELDSLRSRHQRGRDGSAAQQVKDLEEQLQKWEMLYFESAEQGARKIQKLEQELEELRDDGGQRTPEKDKSISTPARPGYHLNKTEMKEAEDQPEELSYINAPKDEAKVSPANAAAQQQRDEMAMLDRQQDEMMMLDQIEKLEEELREKDIRIELFEYEKRKAESKLAEEQANKDPLSGIKNSFDMLWKGPAACVNDNVCVNVVYRQFPDAYL